MAAARNNHTATLLATGSVLAAAQSAGAERFDPTANTWSVAGTLAAARQQHTATPLPSRGAVTVAGTQNSFSVVSAELFDPTSNSWISAASLTTARGSNNQSATNYPLVQLRRVDSEQIMEAACATTSTRSATSYQSAPLLPATSLPPGRIC